jgi:hypothetical protein
MAELGERYERSGKLKPCSLGRRDLQELTGIVQETFTKAEIDRCFRISTTMGEPRVFNYSLEEFLARPGLPRQLSDMSFWIEGWDDQGRLDRNILVDFSRYAISFKVEGADPVWVYDRFKRLSKYLEGKTSWYWPLIYLERFLIFFITILVITNVIISFRIRETAFYLDKAALVGLWTFLVFYDTRKLLPYTDINLGNGRSIFRKENIYGMLIIVLLVVALAGGTILPFFKGF